MTLTPEMLGAALGPWLWAAFLVFLRVGAVVALMPGFGEKSVSARIRLVVALCFTMVVLPAIAGPELTLPEGLVDSLALAGAEVVTGLVFGIVLRLFVMALQMAGTIAAQSASLSQLFGGSAAAEPQPAIGHVLVVGGLALAAILGLHVQAAAYLIDSYILVPLGQWPDAHTMRDLGLAEIGRSLGLAFTLAMPFVAAALIYNLVLGVINRAMPQLMVTFVGAPALTAGGLVLLALSAPLMLAVWAEALGNFMANPFSAPP